MKALDMMMNREYKLRRDWADCMICHHIIAPEGYPKICLCPTPVVKEEAKK